LKDGWFHTGDLARIDEDGYIYLTGRKNNLMILPSGENVSPEELETLLGKIPAVREVLVRQKGDKICARICCLPAAQDQVRAFVHATNRTLPLYKRIAAVEFTDQPLPRLAQGIIQSDLPSPFHPAAHPCGSSSARQKVTLCLKSKALYRPFTR